VNIKKLLNTLLGRLVLTALAIALQLAWLLYSVYFLGAHSRVVNLCLTVLSLLGVVYIINSKWSPEVKLAWIVPMLLFPIFGGILFFLTGGKGPGRKLARSIQAQTQRLGQSLPDSSAVLDTLGSDRLRGQSNYLVRQGFPLYQNTQADYYPTGEAGYAVLLEELRKAEKFIFLEYFIIEPGVMWNGILEILQEKAAQGVDVRVMYDDIGSVSTLPFRYDRTLEKMGIRSVVFNPFVPFCSVVMNNRDHRKIAVIDGNVAFTGGANLADEYINQVEKYGHWKDNMLRLTGEGVWSMTIQFLELWDACTGTEDQVDALPPICSLPAQSRGYVQPYYDTPLDHEYLGENVYLNLINQAREYVFVMTPYLIIDSTMKTALTLAAKRGVSVKIITPGIPDKKVVWDLTRCHYPELLEAGVEIYEYSPGFLHSKICVCDDEAAVVGTINMDYRSLYLHFENACLLLQNDAVYQAKADFTETLTQSEAVSPVPSKRKTLGVLRSIYGAVLRLFAPLL
jgi:cardiolipin synthase